MRLKNYKMIPWNKNKKGLQVAWNKGTKGLTKPNRGSFKKGRISNFKGKKHTKDSLEKNRLAHLGKRYSDISKEKRSIATSGSKHYNWKGGISSDTVSYRKQWRERNIKLSRYYSVCRRAMKRGTDGVHTLQDWDTLKAQYNWTCPSCKKVEPEILLTEDHIIPLTKGGSNNIENIQPLCKSCNSKKHTKIIKYDFILKETK
jgi:5-methylcytosine-specific restriction endonuclease McrA